MMERYLLYILLPGVLFSSSTLSSVSHSHFFFTTATVGSTFDYPSYYVTKSIDDITLYWYDSNNEVIERRVPWFKSTYATLLDASFGELNFQRSLQGVLQRLTHYLNDTEGFHVMQMLDGCILYNNGTFDTAYSYHYDGKPFLHFNVEKGNWIPEDPRAEYYTTRLNMDQNQTEELREILVNTCVPHIKELLSLGNCTFNRREQPTVIVTQTPITNSTYRLNCRAYGHYPMNISMLWYKNGGVISESQMESVTLPLPDLTYLTWLFMNITPMEGDIYTCRVTHDSLMTPHVAEWRLSGKQPDLSTGGSISIGVVIALSMAAVLLLVLATFGSVSCAKSKRERLP